MPSSFLSKLNPTIVSVFERAARLSSRNSVLPYSPTLLSDSTRCSLGSSFKAKSMAASNSTSVFGDVYVDDLMTSCASASDFAKPTGVFFNDRSRTSSQRAALRLRRKDLSNSQLSRGHFLADVKSRNGDSSSLIGPRLRNLHSSSLACYSAGAAHDVSLDGSSPNEPNPDILSDQYVLFSYISFDFW